MRLGEMLVRDGRLTEEQLAQAIARQGQAGGRLGTILVEMGMVDLDALTVYLGLELGIPIATGAALERAKKLAVRLLSPADAVKYRCVPLLIQDRQLVAAIEDPLDMEILSDLQELTGHRILPRVAPEVRIYYYIERYYGVARPRRFVAFGDTPRGNHTPSPDLPAAPLPGLPPRAASVVPAPTPAPPLRMMHAPGRASQRLPPPPVPSAPPIEEEAYEELELDAADLVVELEADATDTAAQAAPVAAPHTPTPAPESAPAARDESYEPRDLIQTLDMMRDATSRNDIARALMGYARHLFDTGVLFIVRDNMAFGWKSFGATVDPARTEALLLPLDAPSLFHVALHDEDQLHTGAPLPGTLHNYLYKVLRCPAPAFAYVRVISIGRRRVNILYGHRDARDPLPEAILDGLKEVGDAAADAYVRMITAQKKRADSDAGAAEGSAKASGSDDDSEFEVPTKVGKKTKRPDPGA